MPPTLEKEQNEDQYSQRKTTKFRRGMIRKRLDELFGSGLCVRCFVGLSISFLDSFSMHFSIIPKPITKQFLKPFSYHPWPGGMRVSD